MIDVEFFRDLCRPLGQVTSKRMFGGLCLWHEGLAFALVIADTLYFKVDGDNAPAFDARDLPRFSYTTATGRTTVMSYARAPEEVFDDPEVFAEWARGAIAAARRAAAAKAAKPRRARSRKSVDVAEA
ncbi:MAG: TfoX/Sxy family protein [Phyllobacteriaceae bacterium]|nr:TfoX/Sxy family protein [Phyllobacteriaceae bacterium]